MFIANIPTKTKSGKISHMCYLLRESYRDGKQVKSRTLANITHLPANEREAVRLALKYKDNLVALDSYEKSVKERQGKSVAAVWLVYELANRLGIKKALGKSKEGKLALWQVIARTIGQGSRKAAVRMTKVHAAHDILDIKEEFDENDLYKNLAWLAENQRKIEKRLFNSRVKEKTGNLFLYDVTSSYFEGMHNELSGWGYDRDGKKGKKQVVIGLLCDEEGDPLSVEVFNGNTRDFNTIGNQIKKTAHEFNCERVTFVGDRGMIKSSQIEELNDAGFHYITAITKPQIEKLLREGVFQLELFDTQICEIEHEEIRYILRRNPQRVKEIAKTRNDKKESVEKLVKKKNTYLYEHKRAWVSPALTEIEGKINKLKISGWLKVEAEGRILKLREDSEALAEESKLDGCYVIKSDLPKDIDKQIIHDRYKDLAKVEQAFRTCKTIMLEMRPWYVRKEESTRGHAFVVMLSYIIARYLQKAWKNFDFTVKEALKELSTICSIIIEIREQTAFQKIPEPLPILKKFLSAANVKLPKGIQKNNINVGSKKKK